VRRPAAPAADHREPARDALSRALEDIDDADALDRPLIWAAVGTGYAVLCAASAIMTTGTRIARALEDNGGQRGRTSRGAR
jgi:hypothetical protein